MNLVWRYKKKDKIWFFVYINFGIYGELVNVGILDWIIYLFFFFGYWFVYFKYIVGYGNDDGVVNDYFIIV